MSNSLFFILLVLIGLGFYFNETILKYIHRSELLNIIKKSHLNILFTIILVLVILIGALNSSGKKKYSTISQNFDNIRTPASQKRPNPMFDIDTYW